MLNHTISTNNFAQLEQKVRQAATGLNSLEAVENFRLEWLDRKVLADIAVQDAPGISLFVSFCAENYSSAANRVKHFGERGRIAGGWVDS